MEQNFKIKFEIFGIQKIANVKASTRTEAESKFKKSLVEQVKILTVEYKEPDVSNVVKDVSNVVKETCGNLPKEFTDIFGSMFGGKK